MKKRTSKQILAETLLEQCESHPLESISLKEIIDASGLSVQTFYNHFEDKTDLIFYIYTQEIAPLFEKFRNGSSTFEELLSGCIFVCEHHRQFLRRAFGMRNTELEERIDQFNRKMWEESLLPLCGGLKEGEAVLILHLYCYGVERLLLERIFAENPVDSKVFLSCVMGGMPEKLRRCLKDERESTEPEEESV